MRKDAEVERTGEGKMKMKNVEQRVARERRDERSVPQCVK